MQMAYHTTIEEFPSVEFDEVTNPEYVVTNIDGQEYHVMLDFTGETAPEIQFALPAYYNEQERQRVFAEMQAENAQAVQEAENVNAQLNGTILTVTNRNGISTSSNVQGPEGPQGPPGIGGEQSDWNETDPTAGSYIKNKPNIYTQQQTDQLLAGKQNVIADLATIRSNAEDGKQALTDVTAVEQLIPSTASAQNKLADQNFVNSSVATNTANYISNNGEPFTSLAQLEAYSGTLTNNDYAFVVGTDAAGNTTYTRYKYNADTQQWAEEYVLNNSSFTAEQWAAIQSGITAALVGKLSDLPTNAELTALLGTKPNTSSLAAVAFSGSYNDLSDKLTVMGASGSGHKGGLVPDTPSTSGTTKYLREDGTWSVPDGGAGGDVQADWSQTDPTAEDYIKNKPTVYTQQQTDQLLAGKQNVISDLATIRSNAEDGKQALTDVTAVEQLIPSTASAQNKLADQNFVNSSVATNTANYISNNGEPFTSLAQLEAYSGTLTNNDYAFVVGTDSAGNTTYTRYKYNADAQQWAAEYVLNNSSFTAEQWAAIQSGITAVLVGKLSDLPTNSELTNLFSGKQDTILDLATIRSGAALGATSLQPTAQQLTDAQKTQVLTNIGADAVTEKVDVSTFPQSLKPDTVYRFGTLTGSVTIPGFTSIPAGDTKAHLWIITFNTSTTAPTITWPADIVGWVDGSAPTIDASKSYQITVFEGLASIVHN